MKFFIDTADIHEIEQLMPSGLIDGVTTNPSLIAKSACAAEKQRVTFTIISFSLNVLHVLSPAGVKGTLTATFLASDAKYNPSSNIFSYSVAVTSALTGPGTIEQIVLIVSAMSFPLFAINDGFVVTPSIRPLCINCSISGISAVSIKNFIVYCIPYTSYLES